MSLLSLFRRHTTAPVPFLLTGQTTEPDHNDDDEPIAATVPGPAPKPCCDRYQGTGGWNHSIDCRLPQTQERYPLGAAPGPRYTDPRWTHLNAGAR